MKLIINKIFILISIFFIITCKDIEVSNEIFNQADPLHNEVNLALNFNSSIEKKSDNIIKPKKEIENVIKYHYRGDILDFSFSVNPESVHDLKKVDNQIFKNGIFGSSYLVRSLNDEERKSENFINLLAKDSAFITLDLLSKSNIKTNLKNNNNLQLSNNNNSKSNNTHLIINKNINENINKDFNFSYLKNLYEIGDYKKFLINFKK